MKNFNILKKQIIYRSTHRGSKEMDLLLGKFVNMHINNLKTEDLEDLDKLMAIDDETLYMLYFNKKNNGKIPDNKISQMFKDFKL